MLSDVEKRQQSDVNETNPSGHTGSVYFAAKMAAAKGLVKLNDGVNDMTPVTFVK